MVKRVDFIEKCAELGVVIDTGVRIPEAPHVERNRAAAKAMRDGRPMLNSQRFNEAKYRAERGGYRRHGPGYSLRGEKPAQPQHRLPYPLWLRKMGFKHPDPNAKAPSSDMKALNEDFRAQHRT